MFMTKYVGSNVLVSVLLVSWWSLNCVSVVVGVLVAVWWCFGCVAHVLVVFLWCLGGVPGECLRGIQGIIFFWQSWLARQYEIGVKGMKRDTLLFGVVCWVNLSIDLSNILSWVPNFDSYPARLLSIKTEILVKFYEILRSMVFSCNFDYIDRPSVWRFPTWKQESAGQ